MKSCREKAEFRKAIKARLKGEARLQPLGKQEKIALEAIKSLKEETKTKRAGAPWTW